MSGGPKGLNRIAKNSYGYIPVCLEDLNRIAKNS
jgi:hypothetical protein